MPTIVRESHVSDCLGVTNVGHSTGLVAYYVEQLDVTLSIARQDKMPILGKELGDLVAFSVAADPSVRRFLGQIARSARKFQIRGGIYIRATLVVLVLLPMEL